MERALNCSSNLLSFQSRVLSDQSMVTSRCHEPQQLMAAFIRIASGAAIKSNWTSSATRIYSHKWVFNIKQCMTTTRRICCCCSTVLNKNVTKEPTAGQTDKHCHHAMQLHTNACMSSQAMRNKQKASWSISVTLWGRKTRVYRNTPCSVRGNKTSYQHDSSLTIQDHVIAECIKAATFPWTFQTLLTGYHVQKTY